MNNHILKYLVPLFLIVFVSSACNFPVSLAELANRNNHQSVDWVYTPTYNEPIILEVNGQEAVLGNLTDDGVMVKIPADSREEAFTIVLDSPQNVPQIFSDEFTPIGAPIELKGGTESMRLDQPALVCFSNDISSFDGGIEYGEAYIAYFNGEEWDYIKPESLYLEDGEGVACFYTYHFSLFGWGKISAEKRLEKYTHNAALSSYIQGSIDEKLAESAESIVKHILTKNLGIKDESIKEQVLSSLLLDDQWGEMVSNIKAGDPEAIKDIGVLAGKTIVMVVPDSTMKSALKALTGDTGLGVAKAATDTISELADGDFTGAAKIIVEGIADQFVVTTAAKIVVQGVEASIQYWKNEEIEAAYQAYANGANGYFYGYNVDPENFDAVWSQMRGLARQLEIEAIKEQNEARQEIGYPNLTEEEEQKIRESVRMNLNNEFMNRQQDEALIRKKEAEIKKLIELYEKNSLLASGVMGYHSEYEIEQRLDTLLHLKDKMMHDLGATELMDGVLLNDNKLGMDAVVAATLVYMTDGKEAYNDHIFKTFNVNLDDVEEEVVEETEEVIVIEPQKVIAVYDGPWHPYWEHQCSENYEKFTLEVWNVGQTGGSETETARFTSIVQTTQDLLFTNDDPCDSEERIYTEVSTGWFSGGPNGYGELFRDGVATEKFSFVDGSTVELYPVNYPEAKYILTVENPDAFKGFQ